MPVTLLQIGEENVIKRIGGSAKVRQHLKDLGFNEGEKVKVVSKLSGNLIIVVKNCRIAIDGDLAKDIFV